MPLQKLTPAAFSVRSFLFAIVIFATVPPVAFSVVALLNFADSERTRAEQGLIESARGIARAIDADFAVAIATLTAIRNSGSLEKDDLESLTQHLSLRQEKGHGLALFDAAGHQVVNTNEAVRTALPEDVLRTMTQTLADHELFISSVLKDDKQAPYALVAIPVFRDSTARWYLATFLYGDDFAGVIWQPGVPEDWIVSIVDKNGTHIRRSHLNDEYAGKPLVSALIDHMAVKKTGTLRLKTHEGIDAISTVAYAPMSGWTAAVGLPTKLLEEPLWRSLQTLTYFGVALVAAALALAFYIAGKLNRVFRQVQSSARTLGRGEIVVATHSSIREANDIVESMVQVSHDLAERSTALNELNNSLETLVARRTAELVDEMTRREESERQLHHLQRIESIGKLTGGIAHDFNNMLAVVIGSLQLIQRRLARGDTDVDKYINNAIQGADSAAKLTQRLLAYSRQQALSPETMDCNRLIADMTEMMRRTLPEIIEIETVLAGGLWQTFIDKAGLENSLLNLALNARDAMPDGGKLTVETGNTYLDDAYAAEHKDVVPGQYVMVAVTDTGGGIASDILEEVFEPFFTTKKVGHGTGLGLSQVYGFIKQSGGHIKIYSEPGHGTTVKLYMPRLGHGVVSREARRKVEEVVPLARNHETILVVEDEDTVRISTVGMLEELGYTVHEAANGNAALDILNTGVAVNLVVTDVVMPGMNGRQLADEMKRRWPDINILFTTGYTRNAIIHNGTLDAGVELIGKPYSLEELAQKVATLLSNPAPPAK